MGCWVTVPHRDQDLVDQHGALQLEPPADPVQPPGHRGDPEIPGGEVEPLSLQAADLDLGVPGRDGQHQLHFAALEKPQVAPFGMTEITCTQDLGPLVPGHHRPARHGLEHKPLAVAEWRVRPPAGPLPLPGAKPGAKRFEQRLDV